MGILPRKVELSVEPAVDTTFINTLFSFENGIIVLEHGGATIGFSLYVTRIPSKKLTVAVFANRDQGDPAFRSISKALISIFSGGEFPTPEEYR